MDLNQKRKLLQAALDGNDEGLRKLHLQRRKQQMPYVDVKGIVDIRQCHPGFLDLLIADSNTYEDRGHWILEPLRGYIQRYQQLDAKEQKWYSMAMALIDKQDKQYEELPLSFVEIESRNGLKIVGKGGTVGLLRRLSEQSQRYQEKAGWLAILFEPSLSQLDHYAGIVAKNKTNHETK